MKDSSPSVHPGVVEPASEEQLRQLREHDWCLRQPDILRKFAGSSLEMCSSISGTWNPRAAVKSSSLPIITSTSDAMRRLTATARSMPPCDFQSDARKLRS